MKYSYSTGGFYCDIHTTIPADAVAITQDDYADLLTGQSAGQRIVADRQGRPILVNPPSPWETWSSADETWVITAEDERQAGLRAHLADLRWQRETAGVTVDGLSIATDRESQALITGAVISASQASDPAAWTIRWKTRDGFVTLTAEQITTIGAAVRAHVQASFDAEATLTDDIAAGAITSLTDLDAAWAASASSNTP